jgi:hypothetical protein
MLLISIGRITLDVFDVKLLFANRVARGLDELLLDQVALIHIFGLSEPD